MSEASADIFAVHPRALICGLCEPSVPKTSRTRAASVLSAAGGATTAGRAQHQREGRIGKWGFIVGE